MDIDAIAEEYAEEYTDNGRGGYRPDEVRRMLEAAFRAGANAQLDILREFAKKQRDT